MAEKPDSQPGLGSRVRHPHFGEGIIVGVSSQTYTVHFKEKGRLEIARGYVGLEILEAVTPVEEMVHLSDVEKSLVRILRKWSDISEIVPLGDRWMGGTMILQPANQDLQTKEIPIETLFHKIVMIRDRLRVLEQNINSHPKLTDEEKVNLQQYITRCYGSLTTFNVLFKEKDQMFVGEKSSS